MLNIVYLCSVVTLPGSPDRREDGFEHDLMMECLRAAFRPYGGKVHDIAWDDVEVNWSDFDAVMIGTTWDYWDRHDHYLLTLEEINQQTRLFNSASMARWNSHKKYLGELEEKGVSIIPTLWLEKPDTENIHDAFQEFDSDKVVLKRQVGAGADGQFLIGRDEVLPALSHPMMVQPFLSTIQSEGEYSFVFIDGELSHTVLKTAHHGEYRIQSLYGGKEYVHNPSREDVQCANTVIDKIVDRYDEIPLYARVDMVRDGDGNLLLMEVELTEPFLYPVQGPDLGHRLFEAIKRRVMG